MNKIQKQKGLLIGIAIAVLVASIVALVGGILLLVSGIANASETAGILKIVFGAILLILGLLGIPVGIRWLFVGFAITSTTGSVKQGNIAKEYGTINMKKCDKCGTERKESEECCSNCGKPFEKTE